MDKASIIGDAVSYVHDLQAQSRKLKAEVSGLEASLLVSENYQGSIKNTIKAQNHPICKKIIQVCSFFFILHFFSCIFLLVYPRYNLCLVG
jgi:hypothetical protein